MSGTFAGSNSMRVNYVQGVDSYYQSTGGEYRNPHFASVVVASQGILEGWWSTASSLAELPAVRVLDLACGSGEATQALQRWWGRGSGEGEAARQGPRRLLQHVRQDVQLPPATPGSEPKASDPEPDSPLATKPQTCALEQTSLEAVEAVELQASTAPLEEPTSASACAAAAQATSAASSRPVLQIDACDPYTYEAFKARTGRTAERWTFQDITDGCLAERSYQLCICSYALHVLDESKLFSLLMQLSLVTAHLIVLSPHKKPQIGVHTGWQLLQHRVEERVHAWLYESLNVQQ